MTARIKIVTYACPQCGQRIEMRVPVTSAICHQKHRATVMRIVADVDAAPRP